MATTILKITIEDINAEVNPIGDKNLLLVGDDYGQYPTAKAEIKAEYWDDYVTSRLPEKYRSKLTEMNGEIVTNYFTPGLTLKLNLRPVVEGSVVLFRNYFDRHRQDYEQRKGLFEDPSTYTVDYETGEITFIEPLAKGDNIIADYGHGASGELHYLKQIALNLIVAEFTESLPSFRGNTRERADDMRRQAYSDLDRLKSGQAGLQLFDKLHLVDELETRNATHKIDFGMRGGLL